MLTLLQRRSLANYMWCGIGCGTGGFTGGGPPGVTGRGAGMCFVNTILCVALNGLGKNTPVNMSLALSMNPLVLPSTNENVTWSFG